MTVNSHSDTGMLPAIHVQFRWLALTAYLLLIIPILIFFWGWLRWYYASLFSALLCGGFFWLFQHDYNSKHECLALPLPHFIGITAIVGLWVAFSGNCGLGYGCYDIPWRNIFLSDLIEFSWPVEYDDGRALAYYIVFWMIPALAGKAFGLTAAFAVQWAYEVAIIMTAVGLFAYLLKATKPSRFWMIALMMVLFSGLNLIAAGVMTMFGQYSFGMHGNENYCGMLYSGQSTNFLYRSNNDVIEECYNQILIWIAVPLMLENGRIRSFMFIGLLLAPFSPWACIGIVPFMLVLGIRDVVTHRRGEAERGKGGVGRLVLWTVREVFSPANLSALVSIGIVFGLFFVSGAHFSGAEVPIPSGAVPQEGSFGFLRFDLFTRKHWLAYLVFIVFEFGLFSLFLARRNRRNPLFYTMVVVLALCPLVWVGTIWGRDFCMDASLPGLCILMELIMDKLNADVMGKPLGLAEFAFVVLVVIACCSPVMQQMHLTQQLIENNTLTMLSHDIGMDTFNGQSLSSVANFVCSDTSESLFFECLAR